MIGTLLRVRFGMTTQSEGSPEISFQRPDDLLTGESMAAFEAFNAMQTTKSRHYSLLQRLDEKRIRFGLAPSAKEESLLQALLADHDVQVKRFTASSKALLAANAEAHAQLFKYIGELEEALAPVSH